MDQSIPANPAGAPLPPSALAPAHTEKHKEAPEFTSHKFRPGQSGNPAGRKPGRIILLNQQIRNALLKLKCGNKSAAAQLWLTALECSKKGDHALTIELLKRVSILASPEVAGVTNIQINQGVPVGGVSGTPVLFNPTAEQLVSVIDLATRLRLADQIVHPRETELLEVQAEVVPAGGGNGNGNGNGNGGGDHEGGA
jgi:hypothetical protein